MITNNWSLGVHFYYLKLLCYFVSPAAPLGLLAHNVHRPQGTVTASSGCSYDDKQLKSWCSFVLYLKLFCYFVSPAAPLDVLMHNVHLPQNTIALVFCWSGSYVWCGACLSSGCWYDHKQLKSWCSFLQLLKLLCYFVPPVALLSVRAHIIHRPQGTVATRSGCLHDSTSGILVFIFTVSPAV